MAIDWHHDEVPPSSVHPIEFYAVADPAGTPANNVAPGKQWLKTDNLTTPTWFELYRRNEADDAWVPIRKWEHDTLAEGDILLVNADGRLERLPVGTTGQVLISDGVTLAYGAAVAAITVQDAGADIGTRPKINLIEGANVTLTIADNVGDGRVDVTVAASGGGAVDGTGTGGTIPKWSDTDTLTDSALVEAANDITATKGLILPASTTTIASLRAPHGAAPSSPVNGDVWTTSAGVFVRINGVTVGPLTAAAGSTVDIEDEGAAEGAADTIDFVGAGVDVGFAAGKATVTIAGGGGGWTLTVDEDGTSFANFTSVSGTWSSNGTEIIQTDTAATVRHARITADLPTAVCVFEADVTIVTGAGDPARVGLAAGYEGTLAGTTVAYLEGDTTSGTDITAERSGVLLLGSKAVATAYTTFYTLRLVIAGSRVNAYLDGALCLSVVNLAEPVNVKWLALYSYQASVKFRNIKMYTLTLP